LSLEAITAAHIYNVWSWHTTCEQPSTLSLEYCTHTLSQEGPQDQAVFPTDFPTDMTTRGEDAACRDTPCTPTSPKNLWSGFVEVFGQRSV